MNDCMPCTPAHLHICTFSLINHPSHRGQAGAWHNLDSRCSTQQRWFQKLHPTYVPASISTALLLCSFGHSTHGHGHPHLCTCLCWQASFVQRPAVAMVVLAAAWSVSQPLAYAAEPVSNPILEASFTHCPGSLDMAATILPSRWQKPCMPRLSWYVSNQACR